MKRVLTCCVVILLICTAFRPGKYSYIIVFLNNKSDKKELSREEATRIMEGHLTNIKRLASEQKLLIAGPFEGGGGIFVLNTTSLEEAKGWISTDPGVQAERWNIEMLPFTPRIGAICQAKDPVEMTMYRFVRFRTEITKYNVRHSAETIQKHENYMKQLSETGNVILEASLTDPEGSVLVMKGDLQSDVLEADVAVASSLMSFETKELWIAKGSFCDN